MAKPRTLADLIAKRQMGLNQALSLLDEEQQARWPLMMGKTVDWKLHFGHLDGRQ